MGYIRLLSRDRAKILLDDSFRYLILLDSGEIRLLEAEALLDFLKEKGRTVTQEELDRIMKELKEERDKWWNAYKKNFKNSSKKRRGNMFLTGSPEKEGVQNFKRRSNYDNQGRNKGDFK